MSGFRSVFRQCQFLSRQALGKQAMHANVRCMAYKATSTKIASTGRNRQSTAIDDDYKHSGFLDIDSPASRALKSYYRIPADPFVASARVDQILQKASHDDALEYLTHLRIGLQSTAAWNSLLKHCAAQGKGKQAESDYVQMRKRGIKPNQHTHTIMISLFGNSRSPSAVAKAEAWLKDRIDDGPSLVHYNALLTVYHQHGISMNKAWDQIKDMPFSPDAITYSILFQCASPGDETRVKRAWSEVLRRVSAEGGGGGRRRSSARSSTGSSILAQKAAKVQQELGIHPDTVAVEEKKKNSSVFEIDDKLAGNIVSALLRTEVDYAFGVEVMERLYGLRYTPPAAAAAAAAGGESESRNVHDHLGLVPTVHSLDMMLRFFGTRKAYRQGREFYDLALKKFPSLKPDRQLQDTRVWLESRQCRTQWKQNKNP